MNAPVRNVTIAQRLGLHLTDAAWHASIIRAATPRSFNPRHLIEALRTVPANRSDLSAVAAWISGPLRRFFPFGRCVGFYGEFARGRVTIRHRLAVGYEGDALQRVEDLFLSAPRGCLAHWFETRRPLVIDCARPPCFAAASDVALFKENKPGSIAAHGIVDPNTGIGSFFGFSGVQLPLGQEHVQALDLIAPILNGLQLDLIASEMAARRDKLDALSPRQREITQFILSGRDNGGIAAAMRLSEKTVRNNVSEIYARLGTANRAELFALLRG
jgi:DNA-binding CsgD family transcriptional regulator